MSLLPGNGLKGIEWGGDIHVPVDAIPRTREVSRATNEAGLAVAAYGSYYRVAESEGTGLNFSAVCETASALEAPTIRVWAGTKNSEDATEDYWQSVIEGLHRPPRHGFHLHRYAKSFQLRQNFMTSGGVLLIRKAVLKSIKALLKTFAGALGGIVFGGILALSTISLKNHFSWDSPSLLILIPLGVFGSLLAGLLWPRIFMPFFLSPLSWILDSGGSSDSHPSSDSNSSLPDFFFNVLYMIGLILLVVGALFSLPWVVCAGVTSIVIFAAGMARIGPPKKRPAANL